MVVLVKDVDEEVDGDKVLLREVLALHIDGTFTTTQTSEMDEDTVVGPLRALTRVDSKLDLDMSDQANDKISSLRTRAKYYNGREVLDLTVNVTNRGTS